jgi:hypothetical protein
MSQMRILSSKYSKLIVTVLSITAVCLLSISALYAAVGTGNGLCADYYAGENFDTFYFNRTDPVVDFSWPPNTSPPPIPAGPFSVRWHGKIEAPVTGVINFCTNCDDGSRLWVNGVQLVNDWTDHGAYDMCGTINLTAGQYYDIVFEYYENGYGPAEAHLKWSYSGVTTTAAVPQSQLYCSCLTTEKSVNTDTAAIGDMITYTINTSNCGVALSGVQIWDTLAANLLLQTANPAPSVSAPPFYRWDVANMAAGTAITITITAQVVSGTNGEVVHNKASNVAVGMPIFSSNDAPFTIFTPGTELLKSANPSTRFPGETTTYTISWFNPQPLPNPIKMNLRVKSGTCDGSSIAYSFEISNYSGAGVDISHLSIGWWISDNIAPSAIIHFNDYGGATTPFAGWNGPPVDAVFNPVSPPIMTPADRQAAMKITYSTVSTNILPNNSQWTDIQQRLQVSWPVQFLNSANYYSKPPGAAYVDDPHFVLYYDGVPVSEWLDASTPDPNTGCEPGYVQINDPVPGEINYIGSSPAGAVNSGVLSWDLSCVPGNSTVTFTWWGSVNAGTPAGTVIPNRAEYDFYSANGLLQGLSLYANVTVLGATPTFTRTPTSTITMTYSPTGTSTSTMTGTPTFTRTSTPTSTPTGTPTYTMTATPSFTGSPTPTSTITMTYTETVTPTNTRTASPTFSVTDTVSSNTPTVTHTNTATNTATPTYTYTPSPTATFTGTPSDTLTDTYTVTRTPTFTATYTGTGTQTPTFSATDTISSNTPTSTPTYTVTHTMTPTYSTTLTPTHTSTATETYTTTPVNTVTCTMTVTMTLTYSVTYTCTYTRTDTLTLTQSPTQTGTPTYTPTCTPTPTFTESPTITETTPSQPFIIIAEVFNETGEKVAVIGAASADSNFNTMEILFEGHETSVYDPDSGALVVRLPGVKSQSTPGDALEFTWNGDNQNGQQIGNGVYYIKVTTTDQFGHNDTLIKEISLLRSDVYTWISIYNSAGELVRRLEKPVAPASAVKMDIGDVLYIGNDSGGIKLNYTDSEFFDWDGRNALGRPVSSGIYEIALKAKAADGTIIEISRTVTIMSGEQANAPGDIKIYPNPCVVGENGPTGVTFAWSSPAPGTVNIKIYNIGGELVRVIKADMAAGSAVWDLKTPAGSNVNSGLFITVVEGISANGSRRVKTAKLAIVRKVDLNSDKVN